MAMDGRLQRFGRYLWGKADLNFGVMMTLALAGILIVLHMGF